MTKLIRSFILSIMIVSVLASCSFSNTTQTQTPLLIAQPTSSLAQSVTIELTVQADTSVPFNAVGQVIKYNYNIKNTGSTSTPGPVVVTGATCPEINTVGNLDTVFDANETLTCTSSYTITQSDLDKGSVTNIATATVNGIASNPVTTTVPTIPATALSLTKSVDPATYDHVSQTVKYTYVIKNSGSTSLGPAQFTVNDSGIGTTPINCGDVNVTLASNATVTCSATYTVTQADMGVASVSTSATASGGGVTTSQPASATITKSTTAQSNSNLTAGSTIKHQVVKGEWLWQIARCYGADPEAVVKANPQLPYPGQISPDSTVTVPNIGSAGKIYGKPCVGTHTVQAGDTWSSIALKYNADATVLQKINSNILTVGKILIVPLNSANLPVSTTPAITPTITPTVTPTRTPTPTPAVAYPNQ